MTSPLLQANETTRQAFKHFLNPFMLLMWRLGLGSLLNAAPQYGGRLMVLTHTGRKSGVRHRQPLNYSLVDGEVYCLAGFGRVSDWYKNILKNPNVELWLPDGRWEGVARDISDNPDRPRLLRECIRASGFAGYAAGLDAIKMSDAELETLCKDYRLIHIRRTRRCTGQGGPGDLAWAIPATALALFAIALLSKRRQ